MYIRNLSKVIFTLCIVSMLFLVGCNKETGVSYVRFEEQVNNKTTQIVPPVETEETVEKSDETIIETDETFGVGYYNKDTYINQWLGVKYEAPNGYAIVDTEDELNYALTSVNLTTGESVVLRFDTVSTTTTLEDVKQMIVADANTVVFTSEAEPKKHSVTFEEITTYTVANIPFTMIKYSVDDKNLGGNVAWLYKLNRSHLTIIEVRYESEGSLLTMLKGFTGLNYEGEVILGE